MNEQSVGVRKSPGVTLAAVAQRVGLAPGTVSAVLNNSRSARSIPERTKTRIHTAVREMGYRPNFFAQSLRARRSNTIGVIVEEIGDAYNAGIISGIEQYLREKDFLFLTVAHRQDPDVVENSSHLLMERGVDGFIMVDMPLREVPALPSVAVAGHGSLRGVANVVLDHHHAARLGLGHLLELGHTEIAFMKGPSSVAESEERWKAICAAARELGVTINPERVVQMESADAVPQGGYPVTRRLLDHGVDFTALFAYNDIAAIGAIRAFQEKGLRVPHDISVLGFDDIQSAAYSVPSLSTVRQPLGRMGSVAAQTLLDRLAHRSEEAAEIVVEPELVVRESTCAIHARA